MKSRYELPITIYEALEKIIDNTYLLPAIQRKFVWKSDQIERLFDSIMRGYPINSFMFWKIEDDIIKNSYKFYKFLTNYREFYHDENEFISTIGYKDFFAVIDGQQRLTSLYIGLKGTYAYRLPRKWLKDNEDNIPTRHLYLDLGKELTEEESDERKMKYNFRFLTEEEYKKMSELSDSLWFKLNDIYRFAKWEEDELDSYMEEQGWNKISKKIFRILHRKVFKEELISFYLETSQEIDTVLDIFIRTNSGGEPLSYSNLLMSFITAHWQKDSRKEFSSLVHQIHEISSPGFWVDADFLLKTCLVLFSKDIKFRLHNFDTSIVEQIEKEWPRITQSVLAAFELVNKWGYNDSNVRAKNAFIPLIYYIYWNNLEISINNPILHQKEKCNMRKWFCISLLKRVFGGQSDSVLVGIRRVLDDKIGGNIFPYDEIKDAFRDNPVKNLSFDEDFVDGLLSLHKDNSACYSVMALIYSHLPFGDQIYHLDHLHPAAYFENLTKDNSMSEEDYAFYKDRENWDTIPNLQMLNDIKNESKNAKPLVEWIQENKVDLENQLIPTDVSLDIKDFKDFITKRKALLKERLMSIVK